MNPRIEVLQEKKLVGQSCKMSLVDNKTTQLWRQFAPRIKEISYRNSTDKISLQIYPPFYHAAFKPTSEFEKWAAVEVTDITEIPLGMKSLMLSQGLYAVFNYRGSSADTAVFQYIFTEWLPHSNYELDDRPHFEVLGARYKNNDSSSEEEIWIPIKEK